MSRMASRRSAGAAQVRDEHQRGNVYLYVMWILFGLAAVSGRLVREARTRARTAEDRTPRQPVLGSPLGGWSARRGGPDLNPGEGIGYPEPESIWRSRYRRPREGSV